MKAALLKQTKSELLNLIKVHGKLSVDEATSKLGLAKATVRQHLLALERQALIVRSERKEGKGRPQLVYQLSNQAGLLFPTQEPELLGELLRWLLTNGYKEEVQKFFVSYWEQRKLKFEKRFKDARKNTQKSAQKVLLNLLEEEGFMPKITKSSSGKFIISACNCPFSETIKATQIPCKLEAEFLKNVLQTDLERVSYMPSGATTCTYAQQNKIN